MIFRYQLDKTQIQNLLSSTQSFASQVMNFSRKIDEFSLLSGVFEKYVKRLNWGGVKSDLVDSCLSEIPGVKKSRARALWNAGNTPKNRSTCSAFIQDFDQ